MTASNRALNVAGWTVAIDGFVAFVYALMNGFVPHAYAAGIVTGQGIGFFWIVRDRKQRGGTEDP